MFVQQSFLVARHERQVVSAARILVLVHTVPIVWHAFLYGLVTEVFLSVLTVSERVHLVLRETKTIEAYDCIQFVEPFLESI